MGPSSTTRWILGAKRRHLTTLLISTLFLAVANIIFVPTLSRWVYLVMGIWIGLHLVLASRLPLAPGSSAQRRRYEVGLVVDTVMLSLVYLIADGAQWVGPLFYVYTAMVASATLPKRGATAMMLFLMAAYTLVVAATVFGWVHPTNLIGQVSMEGNKQWGVATTLSAMVLFLFAWLVQRGLADAIFRSEARYARLLEAAPDMIVTFDAQGIVVEANTSAVNDSGYSLAELKSTQTKAFFPEENWDAVVATFQRAIQGGRSDLFDFQFLRKDGEVRWLEASVSPVLDMADSAQILVVARDTTKARTTTEQLRLSDARLRLMLDALNLGFFTVDRDRRVTAIAGPWVDGSGVAGDALLGKTSREFVAPRLAEALERGFDEALAGKDSQFEFTGRTDSDKVKRSYRTFLAPMRNVGGEVVGVVGLWTDITQAKALEVDRLQLQRRLAESERAESLGRLVSGVAHELNNPLTAILNFTDDLTELAGDDRQRLALDVIRAQAHRSRMIVRDLLTFVREGTLRPLSVHVADSILPLLLLTARTGMRGHGVALHEFLGDLDVSLRLDRSGFEQILVNLLENAADAAGSEGAVSIRSRRDGDRFVVEVEDNGLGIPDDHLPHIFEPFFTTKEPGRGMGLGLSVSRGIAQSFDGELTAENLTPPAHGARFTLSLPIAPAAVERAVPERAVPERAVPERAVPERAVPELAAAAAAGRPPTLMIVDDEPAVRLSLAYPLKRLGWTVELVSDGLQAWELLRAPEALEQYDAIICDLRMPKLSGRELYERLAEEAPTLAARMILCTGDATGADFVEFVSRTSVLVLEKPYEIADLLSAIDRVRPAGMR